VRSVEVAVTPLAPPAPGAVEVVERKGLGHPDTICDALAEEFSVALSRFYLDRFGAILHHNVDKVLLRAGASAPAFSGGKVLEPIEIYLAGRAATEYRGVRIPVEELAVESCRAYLRRTLHALDPLRDVRIHCLVRPGSRELVDLFARRASAAAPLANDSSLGAGFAPLSTLERVVLEVERCLNSPEVKRARPDTGEDVKVLGRRDARGVRLTIACAFVDRYVGSVDDYRGKKETLVEAALEAARRAAPGEYAIELNAADDLARASVYLTVTGTSAESGDDGAAGRGNRCSGLITPGRPMTMEAVAGKNPVTHVGKLYNVVAQRIAAAIVEGVAGAEAAEFRLAGRIGAPVDRPEAAEARVLCARGIALDDIAGRVRECVRSGLAGVPELWRELVAGRIPLY
jgi:S-adenosylmethionine synthetase